MVLQPLSFKVREVDPENQVWEFYDQSPSNIIWSGDNPRFVLADLQNRINQYSNIAVAHGYFIQNIGGLPSGISVPEKPAEPEPTPEPEPEEPTPPIGGLSECYSTHTAVTPLSLDLSWKKFIVSPSGPVSPGDTITINAEIEAKYGHGIVNLVIGIRDPDDEILDDGTKTKGVEVIGHYADDGELCYVDEESITYSRSFTIPADYTKSYVQAFGTANNIEESVDINVEIPTVEVEAGELTIQAPTTSYINDPIVITVLSEGAPVEGVTVILGDLRGTTDSDGHVSLTPTSTGTFTIFASRGTVTDQELLNYIQQWTDGELSDILLLEYIEQWAIGVDTSDFDLLATIDQWTAGELTDDELLAKIESWSSSATININIIERPEAEVTYTLTVIDGAPMAAESGLADADVQIVWFELNAGPSHTTTGKTNSEGTFTFTAPAEIEGWDIEQITKPEFFVEGFGTYKYELTEIINAGTAQEFEVNLSPTLVEGLPGEISSEIISISAPDVQVDGTATITARVRNAGVKHTFGIGCSILDPSLIDTNWFSVEFEAGDEKYFDFIAPLTGLPTGSVTGVVKVWENFTPGEETAPGEFKAGTGELLTPMSKEKSFSFTITEEAPDEPFFPETLIIEAPTIAAVGDSFTVTVKGDGAVIVGAAVTLLKDEVEVMGGETDQFGQVAFTLAAPGTFTIYASFGPTLTATKNITIGVETVEEIRATIEITSGVPDEPVPPGAPLSFFCKITNTGELEHTFASGISLISPSGVEVPVPWRKDTLVKGGSKTITLYFQLPTDAETGTWEAKAGIWTAWTGGTEIVTYTGFFEGGELHDLSDPPQPNPSDTDSASMTVEGDPVFVVPEPPFWLLGADTWDEFREHWNFARESSGKGYMKFFDDLTFWFFEDKFERALKIFMGKDRDGNLASPSNSDFIWFTVDVITALGAVGALSALNNWISAGKIPAAQGNSMKALIEMYGDDFISQTPIQYGLKINNLRPAYSTALSKLPIVQAEKAAIASQLGFTSVQQAELAGIFANNLPIVPVALGKAASMGWVASSVARILTIANVKQAASIGALTGTTVGKIGQVLNALKWPAILLVGADVMLWGPGMVLNWWPANRVSDANSKKMAVINALNTVESTLMAAAYAAGPSKAALYKLAGQQIDSAMTLKDDYLDFIEKNKDTMWVPLIQDPIFHIPIVPWPVEREKLLGQYAFFKTLWENWQTAVQGYRLVITAYVAELEGVAQAKIEKVIVTKIVDGDTIEVEYQVESLEAPKEEEGWTFPGDAVETVKDTIRFLGVHAPELDIGTDVSKFAGRVCKKHLENILPIDSEVTIFFDENNKRDVYGRILGTVMKGEESINYMMRVSLSGDLKVYSSPSHAGIYITGKTTIEGAEEATDLFIGLTGLTAKFIPPGEYTVAIRLEKYEDFVLPNPINMPPEGSVLIPGTQELSLLEKTAEIIIQSSPSGAQILLAHKEDDTWTTPINTNKITKETLTVAAPGTYKIHLWLEGYKGWDSHDIVIKEEGEVYEVSIPTLEKIADTGEIYINSVPSSAKISVGGKDIGLVTPETLILTQEKINSYDGKITVALEKADYEPWSKVIPLEVGDKKKTEPVLTPIGEATTLYIGSEPPKAKIFINDIDSGVLTNETLKWTKEEFNALPTPGKVTIHLEKDKYKTWTQDISIELNTEKRVEVILEEEEVITGKVKVSSTPPNAKIFVYNKETDKVDKDTGLITTATLELPCGPETSHLIRIVLPEYSPWQFDQVFVPCDETVEVHRTLKKVETKGTIRIISSPTYATILSEGINLGLTGPKSIELDPDEYNFMIRKDGYEDHILTDITIEAGHEKEFFVDLSKHPLTGSLSISSSPHWASITLIDPNGMEKIGGYTPKVIKNLEPGDYEVKLHKDNFIDDSTTITVKAGETAEVVLELEEIYVEETGVNIQSSPSHAKILRDGVNTGYTTPRSFKLDPKAYSFTLILENFHDKSFDFTVVKDKMSDAFVKLDPIAVGSVTVKSTPTNATIKVNDLDISKVTTATFQLKPGPTPYTITVSKTGYAEQSKSVTIVAGENPQYFFELKKVEAPVDKGVLLLSSTPSNAFISINGADTGKLTREEFTLDPSPKKHQIVISKAGYDDWSTSVTLVGGKRREIHATLIKAAGMAAERGKEEAEEAEVTFVTPAGWPWVLGGGAPPEQEIPEEGTFSPPPPPMT